MKNTIVSIICVGLIFVGFFKTSSASSKELRAIKKKACPIGMVLVDSPSNKVKICVDKYETSEKDLFDKAVPFSNQNYYSYQKLCARSGKRLLSHKEWRVSCSGTVAEKCNKYRKHPVSRRIFMNGAWVYNGKNCKSKNLNSIRKCKNNLAVQNSKQICA